MRLRRSAKGFMEVDVYDSDIADSATAMPPQAAEAAQMIEALQTLPPLTRSVLWLYHVEGFTHEEIARYVGKTPSFSKSQLARGTQKLRNTLAISPATGTKA
jgi:RNA polymerase sigma-70 factor (ECF subfamily)